MDITGVLAAVPPPSGKDGAESFLDTPIGRAVIAVCGFAAILIVIYCVFRMIRSVAQGRPAEGFKVLIFGLLIGALLFNLNLTITGTSAMGGLVGKVFQSFDSVTK